MSEFPPVVELVPHAEGMLLIDRIVVEQNNMVRSEVVIRGDNIFLESGAGVPAYVGFEFMAQTISAYDGLRRRRQGEPPAIGFLLGCRKYEVAPAYFTEGQALTVEVRSLLGEDGMTSFDCLILDVVGAKLASAVINVYRPADPEAFLRTQA